MNATLRDTLRSLPPEPPDDLGLPETARRRAHALRRRRYAAASTGAVAAVAAFALVVSGSVLPDSRVVRPATGDPLVGSFPHWPRRGGGVGGRETAAAVEAWRADTLQPQGVSMVRPPRVLYAGGGDDRPAVVLFHGTGDRGGDRVVLATVEGREADIVLDVPAPLAGIGALTFEVPGAPGGQNDVCPVVGADSPHAIRLLVVAEPGTRSARWRRLGPLAECGERGGTGAEWQDVPLRDGAALVTLPFDGRARIVVETKVSESFVVDDTPLHDETVTGSYGRVVTSGSGPGVPRRMDGTRAGLLAAAAETRAFPDGRYCAPVWAQSLPDGTPVVLCTGEAVDGTIRGAFVAETGDRRILSYDAFPGPGGDSYAAVVQGHDARWLVYAGLPQFTEAAFDNGDLRRDFDLTHGTGFLRIDKSERIADGATVGSAREGFGRGIPVTLVEGRQIGGRS